MQFGCTAQGLLLKEGRFQLLGRTGEQISHAGFRESAGFRDPVRPFRRICCGCNRTDWPSLKLLDFDVSFYFLFNYQEESSFLSGGTLPLLFFDFGGFHRLPDLVEVDGFDHHRPGHEILRTPFSGIGEQVTQGGLLPCDRSNVQPDDADPNHQFADINLILHGSCIPNKLVFLFPAQIILLFSSTKTMGKTVIGANMYPLFISDFIFLYSEIVLNGIPCINLSNSCSLNLKEIILEKGEILSTSLASIANGLMAIILYALKLSGCEIISSNRGRASLLSDSQSTMINLPEETSS